MHTPHPRHSAPKPSAPLNRRQFLRQTAAGAVGLASAPTLISSSAFGAEEPVAPAQKINLACIGASGMGAADIAGLAPHCNIVALCDVDSRKASKTFEQFPSAQRFTDFRRMFDEAASSFDAVLVATPDHTHAVASMMAIQHGKHVYCEKPLAHSVGEVRALMQAAQARNVVTQLGNQGHSYGSIREFVEWVQSGAIGSVHTIHAGAQNVNSAIDRLPQLQEKHAVPPELDWDLWLGPAAYRPYHPAYLPGTWRSWTPFGNGTVGDWLCHVVDPVFWALDLGAPETITAEVTDYDPRTQGDTFPKGDVITYTFPAKGQRGPVTLKWFSGTEHVPRHPDMAPDAKVFEQGAVVMGDKGTIVYGSHGARLLHLIPEQRMETFQPPPQTLPRVANHHLDWLNAIRNGTKAGSDFSYGGPLTEIALLGIIAIKLPGTKLEWDGAGMRFRNSAQANTLLDPPARAGWSI